MGKYRDSLVVGNPMSGKELNLKNGKSGRLSGNGSGIIQKERRKHVHSLSQIPRLPMVIMNRVGYGWVIKIMEHVGGQAIHVGPVEQEIIMIRQHI